MNQQAIRDLFEARLKTLGWGDDQTQWEGRNYTPKPRLPYQEVTTAFGESDAITLAGSSLGRGVFQVRLLYPPETPGTEESGLRAQEISAAFPRNLLLTGDNAKVKIMREAHVTGGGVQGNRNVTFIRIRFSDR